ncbi:DoxX family protein [Candidatus Pacearchaeota archaeon]|nr:DoxX family protein [Candidatus Pacearchaeota archaeon]
MQSEKYSKPILRIALSLVFLYFGYQQITSPESWISFVPSFVLSFGLSAKTFIIINSFLELVLGTLMLIGLYTRFSSLILALHLFVIAFSIGLNPLGIRDFGLAFATLVIFLNGVDGFCLDKKIWKRNSISA